MAVSAEAFGGFQMAWRELKEQGIDPFSDFSRLEFAGFPQDRIIDAVRDGVVDAATVRAETLARMIEGGKVEPGEFRILNPQQGADSPFPLSTRLYPEWPFATLRGTSMQLATRVAQALLSMPVDHRAARVARTGGWTVPLDYSPVHELMRALQIGPYEMSFAAVLKRYGYWFLAAAGVLVALLLLNGYVSRTNRRLKETQRSLRNEIGEREHSQRALARYRDTLEEQVAARTEDLEATNLALEKSRVALRELVRITSAPELSHDEKLVRLLDTGRQYYSLAVGVLVSIDDAEHKACKISGDPSLVPGQSGHLSERCAPRLIALHGEPLDIPNLAEMPGVDPECLMLGWNSYLGIAVMVDGQAHCTLEFADRESRDAPLSQWDHDLLKVMAQWIGDELERQMAHESLRRHQSELARVSRMSTIGEMAASLAHELNQPLTGAINYSSGCLRLLREGEHDTEKLVTGMERTIEGATLAADIIRQIRAFVHKGDAEHTLVDLNTAVWNVAALVKQDMQQHGVDISLDLASELPPVEGNLIQLEQVILNFVRNGIDAMDRTGPEGRRLSIVTRQNGQTVSLATTDTGEGLPEEGMARMFDAFYSTKPDGMGIGLSISRSIIESHQGRIMARSLAGGGAEVSFELPVAGAA
jgi:C4-dicarboxylate-specific signal transduction histidine kinase